MSTDMRRRAFLRSAAVGATLGFTGASEPKFASAETARACAETSFPQVQKLTAHVAEFGVNLKFTDIPAEPLELGKKSILDGLGLALSGSKAATWGLIREYLKPFGFAPRSGPTELGSMSTTSTTRSSRPPKTVCMGCSSTPRSACFPQLWRQPRSK